MSFTALGRADMTIYVCRQDTYQYQMVIFTLGFACQDFHNQMELDPDGTTNSFGDRMICTDAPRR